MRRAANDVNGYVYRSSNRWEWKIQNLELKILPFLLLSTGGDSLTRLLVADVLSNIVEEATTTIEIDRKIPPNRNNLKWFSYQ